MTDLERLIIEGQCRDLLTRYAMAVNEWDLAAFVACFVTDGCWNRPGGHSMRGHAEILAFMESQPDSTERVVRHVNGASLITVLDAGSASSWSQTTVYDVSPCTELPAPMTGPDMVVEYRDQLVRLDGHWRIAQRDTTVVFKAAG